jgi:hypothetical protein
MKNRTRLSVLALETRENPSLMLAPPISQGAPATTAPAIAAASGGATGTPATTPGTGQMTSTGNVTVPTTPATGAAPTTGILGLGNNLSGYPILESSLMGN